MITIPKNSAYTRTYHSDDHPTLDATWTGTFRIATSTVALATFTKALVRAGNTMEAILTLDEVNGINLGTYYLIATILCDGVAVSAVAEQMEIVSEVPDPNFTYCTITGTLKKLDGTPVGVSAEVLTSGTSLTTAAQWKGVNLSAGIATAALSGNYVIVTDKLTVTTEADGSFTFKVIQGQVVTLSYAGIGTPVVIDTTGETLIDLHEVF